MKFEEFSLSKEVFSGVQASGFQECTAVQEAMIPLVLEGKDVSGLSQTGTGKTAAFLIPLIEKVFRSQRILKGSKATKTVTDDHPAEKPREYPHWKKGHFILILVPTRELAQQVYEDFLTLKGETQLNAVLIYGGSAYDRQKEQLASAFEFVISTPGRLIDLYKQHILDLKQCCGVVFDEADRMFDMGFKDDMQFLLYRIPKTRQILLFSATMNFDVIQMAYKFGANPMEFNLSRDEIKAENVKDYVYHIGSEEKPKYLLSILKKLNPQQTIVFSNFKNQVGRIVHFLNENNYQAVGISSLLPQNQRNRVIEHFKTANHQSVLVATDLAARGLDIKGVDLVVNFELPDDPENYIHRMGRTGRAGRSGHAVNLSSDRDVEALMKIEAYLKNKIQIGWLEDDEIIQDFKNFPEASQLLPKISDTPPKEKNMERTTRRRSVRTKSEVERQNKRTSTFAQTRSTTSQKKHLHRDRLLGRHKQESGSQKRYASVASSQQTTRRTSHIIRRSSRKTFWQKFMSFFFPHR